MADELPDDAADAGAADLPDDHDAGPSAADEADAALDAKLAEMGGFAGDEDDAPAPAKGKRAKAAQADEDSDDDEDDEPAATRSARSEDEDDEDDPDEDGDEGDEEEDEDEDMALHRAYTVLHDKAGVPASVLKKTSRAELISWAKRVEAKTEGASKDGSSPAERGRGAPEGAKRSEGGAEPDGKGAAADPASKWATMRAGIAEKLGVDEEAAEGFKPWHDELEAARAELKEARDEIKSVRQEALEREGRRTIDTEVRRLAKGYPDHADDSAEVEKLVKRAARIVKVARESGEPISAREAFDEAAEKEWGKRKPNHSHLRRNGTSTAPERRGSGFSAEDIDEDSRWTAMVDASIEGNRQRIRKLARGLSQPPKPKR